MGRRTLLSWSSGKDSAWALHTLRHDTSVDLAGLFTVINERYGRASMHATRLELLNRQAGAAGLEIRTVALPAECSMEECDEIMGRFVAGCAAEGVECMAFGDLYLEDIRNYREAQLRGSGIEPLFPLWGTPTGTLAGEMLAAGLEAYISSVDLAKLPRSLAGRKWGSRPLLNGTSRSLSAGYAS